MKRSLYVLLVVMLLTLTVFSTASADLPGNGWWSALFIQNIDAGSIDGSVNMTAYPAASGDTSTYGSSSYSFDYGQGLIYDPGKSPDYNGGTGTYIGFDSSLPSGFEGSVVLSASVPVAAISELANFNNGSVGGGGTASARYQGMSSDSIATQLRVPTIKNNYNNHTTTVYIQAAGSDADVTITFNMNDGGIYTQNTQILSNKMFAFDPSAAGVPSDECGVDANTSPCYGSATIESASGPIAGTVVEHPHTGSPAGYALSTRAQTPSDEDTILYFPTIKNDFYRTMTAGASVMNVGTEVAYVQITLKVTQVDKYTSTSLEGRTYTDFAIIEPGSSILFSKWLNNLGGMPAGTFAAATVESIDNDLYDPQPLVGATNDSKQLSGVIGGRGITLYAAFADNSTTDTIAAPIIRELMGDVTGGLTVQNVGSAPATIYFEYYEYGTDNVYTFHTANELAVGEAVNTNRISQEVNGDKFVIDSGFANFSELANKQFSVIATSSLTGGGESIIGLASENSLSNARDMRNYEGISFIAGE